jgi:hypothetical protein
MLLSATWLIPAMRMKCGFLLFKLIPKWMHFNKTGGMRNYVAFFCLRRMITSAASSRVAQSRHTSKSNADTRAGAGLSRLSMLKGKMVLATVPDALPLAL